MKKHTSVQIFIALFAAIYIAITPLAANAGPGHDHGDAAPLVSGVASPRVTAHSDLFELVGIVKGQQMQIHLDRYATNEPVINATLAVEISQAGGQTTKLEAKPQADGIYLLESPAFAATASLAMAFTVVAGGDSDLLAGDLALITVSALALHSHGGLLADWWAHAGSLAKAAVMGAVLMLLAAAVGLALRKRKARGFAASLALLALGAISAPDTAWAGPGHDHGDESAPAPGGNSPKRQADGSVFLPKPSQRQLGVRTQMAELADHAPTVELQGRVVADGNALGRVQPTQQGRLEVPARGLPQVGQRVKKGEVLAVVRFTVNALERSAQMSQLAQGQVELQAAQARLKRLEQLEGIVAQKEIDAAKAEVSLAQKRTAFAAPALSASENLVAPISGVVMTANAAAGQVVDARELVFEIVDPARLRVEALAFEAVAANGSQTAFAALSGNQTVQLQALGAAPALRDAAKVLLFKPTGPLANQLAINQPLRVLLQGSVKANGVGLPTAAIVKSPSNQDMVWVHTAAEVFVPRTVRWSLLDGARVVVTDGLKSGDRVVTQGSALVNQVR